VTGKKGADPVAEEIATVCREWGEIWKRLYTDMVDSTYQFEVIGRGMLNS